LGKPLGSKAGIDLTGYYGLYLLKKKARIIYKIIDQKLVINIISIRKREDLAAYYLAYLRKNNPIK
jgi:mRNA interferase RelE/StbE